MGISLSGLATGIDTATLVKQLIEANSGRLKLMQVSLEKYELKRTAYSDIESKLSALKTAAKALSDSSQLRSFNAVSSDEDTVTVEASSSASEGSHTVEIAQLATADRWVHGGFKYTTSYVGEGNFIFSYNNQELVIQTTAETTLDDLVGLINNDTDNPGVNASILKYDNGSGGIYHLVLSGSESGSDYQVTVNSSNTEVWTADSHLLDSNGDDASITTKLVQLSGFAGEIESGSTADQIHITGTQHDGTAVDVYFNVTQYTTIEDLIGEINDTFGETAMATYEDGQIKLADTTSGTSSMTLALTFVPGTDSTASLTLPTFSQTTWGGSVTASVASLAAATFTETQSAQDSMIRVDGYPEGTWISRSSNTIDDVISGVTLRLHDTTDDGEGGYNNIQVNLSRDTESLKEKINSLVEAYNTVVMFIQESTAYDKEENKLGILGSDYGVTTIWSQIRSAFNRAASGFGNSDTFTAPAEIGLSIDADGMLEFDETEFDEAIVDDYLGTLALIGTVKTGASNSADIKFYSANTYTTAGQYEVRVYGDGLQITSAQIRMVGETEWHDATFDGNVVTGNSEFDSNGNPLYDENSLQFTVDLSKTSETALTATINVKQGFAGALEGTLKGMLDSTKGRVTITKDTLDDQIDAINERIEREQLRLAKEKTRLTEKFARMEKMLALIEQQMSALTSLSS